MFRKPYAWAKRGGDGLHLERHLAQVAVLRRRPPSGRRPSAPKAQLACSVARTKSAWPPDAPAAAYVSSRPAAPPRRRRRRGSARRAAGRRRAARRHVGERHLPLVEQSSTSAEEMTQSTSRAPPASAAAAAAPLAAGPRNIAALGGGGSRLGAARHKLGARRLELLVVARHQRHVVDAVGRQPRRAACVRLRSAPAICCGDLTRERRSARRRPPPSRRSTRAGARRREQRQRRRHRAGGGAGGGGDAEALHKLGAGLQQAEVGGEAGVEDGVAADALEEAAQPAERLAQPEAAVRRRSPRM